MVMVPPRIRGKSKCPNQGKELIMSTSEFASANYTMGQLNAMVKILKQQAGEDGPDKLLRGEIIVSQPDRAWREENGIIHFSVISDGTSGPAWIKRLEKKGFRIGDYAKSILKSKDFKPTSGIPTEVVVLKGMLFSDENRVTKKIRAYAETLSFNSQKPEKPNPEIAFLIREKFSDEDLKAMGLVWIVAMHEPINDSGGDPILLAADRSDDGHWLVAGWVSPGIRWDGGGGFAFALPQISA
jgi:hypothetical protein